MAYQGYTTFKAQAEDGILTVTFDFGTVNVQGQETLMLTKPKHSKRKLTGCIKLRAKPLRLSASKLPMSKA
ncbi:hypothetical protein BCS86_18985 [Vibrio splendidus]|nr:hypothetical protein BCS86_18985 [Vibrio splendidus]